MKSIFTTAGISLLAWLAFAPFQPAEAHEHNSNGEMTLAQIIENGSPRQDGSSLDNSPNRVITDNEGDDPGVDNFETEGTGEPVGRPNVRQPQIDAQREIDDEGQSSLDQSPNRVINDNEGDDPGVDSYEIEGTGEPRGGANVRQPEVDANREVDDEGQSSLDQSPNRVINDNEGDDPGVDSYEVEGTGEADREAQRDTYTRETYTQDTYINQPQVDTRPRYNRPVTGQNTQQQPTVDYNRTQQAPSNTQQNYSNEPVRGLW